MSPNWDDANVVGKYNWIFIEYLLFYTLLSNRNESKHDDDNDDDAFQHCLHEPPVVSLQTREFLLHCLPTVLPALKKKTKT